MNLNTSAKGGETPANDSPEVLDEAYRHKVREALARPSLLNLLWFALLLLIGLPAMVWVVAMISEATGIKAAYVLLALTALLALLAPRYGRSMKIYAEEKRAFEAAYERPGLARFLNRSEPWVFVLGGMVYCTAWLSRVFEGAELGFGGFVFLFAGWYAGGVIGATGAMFTRNYLQDRYGPRLLVDSVVTLLLIAKFTAYLMSLD